MNKIMFVRMCTVCLTDFGRLFFIAGATALLVFVQCSLGGPLTPCRKTSAATDVVHVCVISTDTDFDAIPFDAKSIRLHLSVSHTISLDMITIPRLPALLDLEIDVSFVRRLRNGTFSNVPQLKTLGVTPNAVNINNILFEVDGGAFLGLTNLTSLRLPLLRISRLPVDAFAGLTNLATLDVNQNHLSSVDAGTFSAIRGNSSGCCRHLSDVILAKNRLQDVPLALKELKSLSTVDLHGNNISIVRRGAFSELVYLKDINLANNGLTQLEDGAFSGLEQLRHLYLDGNKLTRVSSFTFVGLVNLRVLNLGSNMLRIVTSGLFADLTVLTSLSISNNQIDTIESGAFNKLANLGTLELNNNSLSNIDSSTFSGLIRLNTLKLRQNSISTVASDAFVEMCSLTEIDLASNKLTVLPKNVFDLWLKLIPRRVSVDLSHNPWMCDCQLRALPHSVMESLPAAAVARTLCSSPVEKRGSRLTDFYELADPSCSTSTTSTITADSESSTISSEFNGGPCLMVTTGASFSTTGLTDISDVINYNIIVIVVAIVIVAMLIIVLLYLTIPACCIAIWKTMPRPTKVSSLTDNNNSQLEQKKPKGVIVVEGLIGNIDAQKTSNFREHSDENDT